MVVLIGDQRPRIESVPPYVRSLANDAIELGELTGLYLDDWQRYVLDGALGVDENDVWSAFEVGLIVSRQNGKGSILEIRELAALFLFPTDRLAIHTAHEHKTASEHFLRVWGLIDNTPTLRRQISPPGGRHSAAYGREFIQTRPEPTIIAGAGGKWVRRKEPHRLLFIARTGSSGRGFTADLVVYDEDMTLDATKIGSSLPALSARPNPQVWYTGSAGTKKSTQEAQVRRRGVKAANGEAPPKKLCFYEWSINWHHDYCTDTCTEHDDPGNPMSIAKANPGLGVRLSMERVENEREAMSDEEFGREILGIGQYPAPLDAWFVIPKKWYTATEDGSDNPPRVLQPVFAIDISPDRERSAIAVAGYRSPDELIGLQVVDYHEGTGWLLKRAKEIQETWHPATWVIDKRAAAGSLLSELEKIVPVKVILATDVAHACGQLYDAFRDDTIRHLGQTSLRTAIAAVDKHNISRDSWAFDRQNSGVDISPLMAVTLAHWGYHRFGEDTDYDARDSVHFDVDEIKRLCRLGVYDFEDLRRLYDEEIITDADREVLANAGYNF